MANRTKNKYLGDVGETQVLRELLDTGASINSLTASDYGWDLHVQLPEEVLDAAMISRFGPKDTWKLSGHVVHVQVKNQTSGSDPSVRMGTLRGWLEAVIPTFVIIVRPEGMIYLSPSVLQAKHDRAVAKGKDEDGSVSMSGGVLLPRDRNLGHLLAIWTKHYQVMMAGADDCGDSFDRIAALPEPDREEKARCCARDLATDISTAWLTEFDNSDRYSTEWTVPVGHFSIAAAEEIIGRGEDSEKERDAFEQEVAMAVNGQQMGDGYFDSRFSKIYTTSGDPSKARDDGVKVIEDICFFMAQFLD
ncbi:hypothetical protein J7E83_14330 [Arthrobacter sp. ISL-48]|uniref:hypothetical protein n=1 Tax=Arthrobacter sp. ISL-48 TaxID=2819110 RepID=UPI001BEB18F8|nr:hypothetical protein [Arthrobacter sp. ISL-48]MBT2533275.1 hypothetical protein [Arthrobacter sp. ISL-48]